MALDLFANNRPKYYYADAKEQRIRVNHCLSISFAAFYLLFAILCIGSAALGAGNMMLALVLSVAGFVAFLIGASVRKKTPDSESYRVISFVFLLIFSVITSIAFDVNFFRFLMMVPLAGAMFYFDKKYTITTGAILGGIPLVISLAKAALGVHATKSDAVEDVLASVVCCLFAIIIIFLERIAREFNEDTLNKVASEKEVQDELLQNVLRVASQVREGTNHVMETVDQLAEATGAVTGEVRDIATNSQVTADNIYTQTVMTQNIQDSIVKTQEHSTDMRLVAEQTMELNQAGRQIMNQMTEQAEAITATNKEVADVMANLQEQAKAVQGIAGTIYSISSQTNLLALNASIEAARAGEAGKGFAVVADEIRALADGTRSETENIARILKELSDNAEKAVTAVESAIVATNTQENLIGEASDSFHMIDQSVIQLTENIESIDSMLGGLSEANNKIVDSITQLSATTEEVSSSTTNAEELSNRNLEDADDTRALLNSIMEVSKKLDRYTEVESDE